MEIKVTYQPTAQELMKASSLFIEKKTFFLILIRVMNVFAAILLMLICLRLFTIGLHSEEWLAGLTALAWLFGRRPANEWLILQRLKSNKILQLPINIVLSLNGVMWEGKGLMPGHMSWREIRYVFEAKNGFVIPNASTRYLWLPFRGFSNATDISSLQQILTEHKISIRKYPKWEC